MTAKGCSYKSGICREVVEQCNGCNRSVEFNSGWYCSACPEPELKWKVGRCNMASHVSDMHAQTQQKINPLKASKRKSKR